MVVSPSWGGPARFPHTFDAGLEVLRDELGLVVEEGRAARHRAATPAERLADLHEAFERPDVRLVITSIGGDDSIRLLRSLDLSALHRDPKIVMGYSDATTLLTRMAAEGLVSFHGPSVMAGLAQTRSLGSAPLAHLRQMLFDPDCAPAYLPYGSYCDGYEDWSDPRNARVTRPLTRDAGPRVLQGTGRVSGPLFGGCLEVLQWLQGTEHWPMGDAWNGRVLFFETSEEAPPPATVRRALRSWGAAGIFDRVRALLVGRPHGYGDAMKAELDAVLVDVIGRELDHPELPILSNLDFGHTDPQWILPLGVEITVDATAGELRLARAPTVDRTRASG